MANGLDDSKQLSICTVQSALLLKARTSQAMIDLVSTKAEMPAERLALLHRHDLPQTSTDDDIETVDHSSAHEVSCFD